MVAPEAFLQAPLWGDYLEKYFVNRYKELDYVLRITTKSNAKIIGVLGSVGSGRTSFLNAVAAHYRKHTGEDDIDFVSVAEVSVGRFKINLDRVSVILIDNVANLDDKVAVKFYNKLYELSDRYAVNVVYTDRVNRRGEARRARNTLTMGRLLVMDLSVDEEIELFKERMKRGGGENLFTDEAIKLLVLRAGTNLRTLFTHAEEAYLLLDKEEGITAEEVKRVIKEIDEREIKTMTEFTRTVLRVLIKHPWVNMEEFIMRIREEWGNKAISNRDIYKSLRELEERGLIISKREGKERRVSTVYEIIGIRPKIEKGRYWGMEL